LPAKHRLAPRLLPVADGRERALRLALRGAFPEIHHHRLARRFELEALADRQPAIVTAVILPEREERTVRLEEGDRLGVVLVKLDLEQDGVGLQVHQPAGGVVLGQRHRAAVQVDDQRRRLVQPAQGRLAHAVAAAVVVERVVGPASGETKAARDAIDERRRATRPVVLLALHEHRRSSGVRLDVVHVVSEALKPDQIMHRLPDHAGDGHLGHHAQHDDLVPVHYVHGAAPSSSASASPPASSSASGSSPRPRCMSCSCRYRPPRASSSSCVPRSTLRPPATPRIWSALRTVESRWAIRNVVRPAISRSSASRITASVRESIELVGSSRTSTGASLRNARATAMRCRSPPESVTPRSPSTVSYFCGRRSMNSCALAAFAASTISSSVASSRP